MTNKTAFTPEELYLLWKAPNTIAVAIMTAHPGGLFSEMVASVKSISAARDIYPSELMQSILTFEQSEVDGFSERIKAEAAERGAQTADDVLAMAITDIRSALGVLRPKAQPEEVQEYRRMLVEHAEKVAQAGKEGGFLGIGGVRVSEAEERILAEIRLAVNRLH
jgi:hypothetical protein